MAMCVRAHHPVPYTVDHRASHAKTFAGNGESSPSQSVLRLKHLEHGNHLDPLTF